MRASTKTAILGALVSVLFVAEHAESARRRKAKVKGPSPAPAPSNATCDADRLVLLRQLHALEINEASLAGVEAEIDFLQRRLDRLRSVKGELVEELSRTEQQVRTRQARVAAACGGDCTHYEIMAAEMLRAAQGVEAIFNQARTEVNVELGKVSQLSSRMKVVAGEYRSLRCGSSTSLDGEGTARCGGLFDEWQRLGEDLDSQENRLPTMRRRLENALARIGSLEKRGKDYRTAMGRACPQSPSIVPLGAFGTTRQQGQSIEAQLSDLHTLLQNAHTQWLAGP